MKQSSTLTTGLSRWEYKPYPSYTPRHWQGQKPEYMEQRRWGKCRGIKKLGYKLKEVKDNKQRAYRARKSFLLR